MRRSGRAVAVLAVVALAAAPAIAVPLLAVASSEPAPEPDAQLVVAPVADATVSQVAQDGDTSAASTLTTCPALCEGNPRGERSATVTFEINDLPRTAGGVEARLRLYSWAAFDAATSVGAGGQELDRAAGVTAGYNEWDVSRAVPGNGTYTFTVRQADYPSRIYWASAENKSPAIRPELVLSYKSDGPAPAPTMVAPWRLAWSDEFNGTALDAATWVAKDNTSVDYDRACLTAHPDTVFVGGGVLTLRAQRRPATCGAETRGFTSAYLTTEGRKSFQYGRFEVRAKSPTGPVGSTGLWPAFWLRPDDGGNGEIDVVELPGGAAYYQAATQSIFYDYTPVKQDNRYPFPAAGHAADGFHTYTTEWEPGVLRWYVDGVPVWQRDRTTTPWFDEVFTKPYHLRLNFQVGGWLGDPDAATRFPADFQVDYVRVWQR
ncbi:glycoside hydrolase family 16 protein [Symbioplanes lichenis]|uniref:glycoside hydrolase family 16 protein n=1 Tax=Symbioplanes lichenis TaxID=1629072 RepID=UPI002739EE42|nr:glycoside hydrolase family 16 protein [Actinoplanes lichenis]